jgi:hypothetical protein
VEVKVDKVRSPNSVVLCDRIDVPATLGILDMTDRQNRDFRYVL